MPGSDHKRELYSGLIRLHVLYHACKAPIFGLGMIEELARHGYRLSPGTLYPLLDGLEKKGLLRSSRQQVDGRFRRVYRATPAGHKALRAAKRHVQELFGELFENETIPPPAIHRLGSRRRA
ncbi:MAG TPA: PadR family transcriptional regulator [Candidatus Dormibacteraeota bacterium]|nr:PadR family transcriptional regulator [Candidatus Dormibacteraeota bacterium]